MRRINLIAALQFVLLPVLAQQPMWLDPKVNSDNRMPRVADFFAYESADKVADGEEASARYMSLEGKWKFNFVKNAYDKPADFYKVGYDDSKWTDFPVPGLFEMNGYGDKIYTNVSYPWNNEYPITRLLWVNATIMWVHTVRSSGYRPNGRVSASICMWALLPQTSHCG